MIQSITQFQTEGVKKLNQIFLDYSEGMEKIAELVYGVTHVVTELGLSLITEEWEFYDDVLRKRRELRPGWHIVRRDETTLTTSLGDVHYHKTYFLNPKTGEYRYLLDELMGLEKNTRLTEDAVARIYEEAAETSYRRGGKNASITEADVSKMTVLNKLHPLVFPRVSPKEKKAVPYLYIDADEDHVALQYLEKKGDIKRGQNNTVMPKDVYVYEGVENDGGKNHLIGAMHFGGVREGTENKELWQEVAEYIEASYDTDALKKIFLSGDGAPWIKAGIHEVPKARFVLDRYHMHRYIVAATSHLKDSTEDARSELYRAIHKRKKWMAEGVFDRILAATESESKYKAVETAKGYILGNWAGIMESLKEKENYHGCSAEGHVSHVFADRMSSRPLGWSRIGADKMSRLRIYRQNKGDMLELVRYQKEVLPKAAGVENMVLSSAQVMKAAGTLKEKYGNLVDIPVYSIPYPKIKKIAALKNHIWGL